MLELNHSARLCLHMLKVTHVEAPGVSYLFVACYYIKPYNCVLGRSCLLTIADCQWSVTGHIVRLYPDQAGIKRLGRLVRDPAWRTTAHEQCYSYQGWPCDKVYIMGFIICHSGSMSIRMFLFRLTSISAMLRNS